MSDLECKRCQKPVEGEGKCICPDLDERLNVYVATMDMLARINRPGRGTVEMRTQSALDWSEFRKC